MLKKKPSTCLNKEDINWFEFQDEDNTGINDLDLIADGRLKRTSYNSLNDIEDQNSFLSSLQYRPDGSLFPRQLRQSPYFALRGKRIPGDDYASTDDKSIFSGDLSDNFPSNTLQSRDKRMISMFTYPVPRYEAMIRRILGQTMKMSDEKAKGKRFIHIMST